MAARFQNMPTKMTYKVTPIPVKQNNFVSNSTNVLDRLTVLLYLNAFYGVNRLFLLPISKPVKYFFHTYTFVVVIFIIHSLIYSGEISSAYRVIKITTCIEILFLMVSTFVRQEDLKAFFSDLAKFENLLKLTADDVVLITPKYRFCVWVFISFTYSVFEFCFLSLYLYNKVEIPLLFYYFAMLAHDSVCVLFFSMLRITWFRLKILKAHAFKILKANKNHFRGIPDKVESLADRTELDINSLHLAYDSLHKCSSLLNSSMSFSMVIMLFSSGLITTLLLQTIFKTLEVSGADDPVVGSLVIYASIRCLKYTVMVVIPCFYSSFTNAQVKMIRGMIHDAIINMDLGKMNRRKTKAFFQLTEHNEFTYALWGVIRLNMSLPLSYASLCATYLVIIIQFSKFID